MAWGGGKMGEAWGGCKMGWHGEEVRWSGYGKGRKKVFGEGMPRRSYVGKVWEYMYEQRDGEAQG